MGERKTYAHRALRTIRIYNQVVMPAIVETGQQDKELLEALQSDPLYQRMREIAHYPGLKKLIRYTMSLEPIVRARSYETRPDYALHTYFEKPCCKFEKPLRIKAWYTTLTPEQRQQPNLVERYAAITPALETRRNAPGNAHIYIATREQFPGYQIYVSRNHDDDGNFLYTLHTPRHSKPYETEIFENVPGEIARVYTPSYVG